MKQNPDIDMKNCKEHSQESMFSSFERIVRGIVANVQEIIRSEVELAKNEVKEEIGDLAKAGAFYGVSAIAAFYAVGLVLLACVYGLATVVAPWLATLIVAVAVAIVGGVAFTMARSRTRKIGRRMEQTLETAKENIQWARNRFK
jgi:uncharacterized membrane protein YqjE